MELLPPASLKLTFAVKLSICTVSMFECICLMCTVWSSPLLNGGLTNIGSSLGACGSLTTLGCIIQPAIACDLPASILILILVIVVKNVQDLNLMAAKTQFEIVKYMKFDMLALTLVESLEYFALDEALIY